MSQSMDRLVAEVTEQRTAVDGILSLVAGMADRLRDAAGDADKVNALADQLDSMQGQLGEAVVANTPAQDTPPADTTPANDNPASDGQPEEPSP